MSIFQKAIGAFLNKGGAGISFSRQQTIEHLNPLIEQHIRLNHTYAQAAAALAGTPLAAAMGEALRTARMDVGKLAETILSMGGTPFSGTSIEPGVEALPEGDALLRLLTEREQALLDATDHEIGLDHQIRTKAILGNVQAHSRERLKMLERPNQAPHR